MKNIKLVLVFILFVACFVSCNNQPASKLEEDNLAVKYEESDVRKIKIITALQKLQKYAMDSDEKTNKTKLEKIKEIIKEFENPDDIATFALMCRSLSYHCSDMDCFKYSNLRPTYDNAYWAVIEKLAKDKEKNKDTLDRIKRESFLDGGALYNWGHIVDGKPL
jgi:hypothetical protein